MYIDKLYTYNYERTIILLKTTHQNQKLTCKGKTPTFAAIPWRRANCTTQKHLYTFKISLEVKHTHYLIREYTDIWQIRQLNINRKRKLFINSTIFLNCFHNSSDLLTLIVGFDLLSREQDSLGINVCVVLCICLMFSTYIVIFKLLLLKYWIKSSIGYVQGSWSYSNSFEKKSFHRG